MFQVIKLFAYYRLKTYGIVLLNKSNALVYQQMLGSINRFEYVQARFLIVRNLLYLLPHLFHLLLSRELLSHILKYETLRYTLLLHRMECVIMRNIDVT